MSKFYIDTPFDNLLVFDINKTKIEKITFLDSRVGEAAQGLLKQFVIEVFDKKDLSVFDYSLLDFDRDKKSFKLYEFLISTRAGETYSYSESAQKVFGFKKYARAVAKMLNANPFIFFVPCHRIVAKNGTGGYAYGVELKIKILKWEDGLNLCEGEE